MKYKYRVQQFVSRFLSGQVTDAELGRERQSGVDFLTEAMGDLSIEKNREQARLNALTTSKARNLLVDHTSPSFGSSLRRKQILENT